MNTPRYLVALLWHWLPPFVLGFTAAFSLLVYFAGQQNDAMVDAYKSAVSQLVKTCNPPAPLGAPEVKDTPASRTRSTDGEAIEHRTGEDVAQRILDPPPTIQPP